MMNEKVLPETLLQLMLNVLAKADSFQYISGIQPFLMSLKGRKYYVYVKNLSSAYFKDRPDTTRAQLPIKDEFSEIKESAYPTTVQRNYPIGSVDLNRNHSSDVLV